MQYNQQMNAKQIREGLALAKEWEEVRLIRVLTAADWWSQEGLKKIFSVNHAIAVIYTKTMCFYYTQPQWQKLINLLVEEEDPEGVIQKMNTQKRMYRWWEYPLQHPVLSEAQLVEEESSRINCSTVQLEQICMGWVKNRELAQRFEHLVCGHFIKFYRATQSAYTSMIEHKKEMYKILIKQKPSNELNESEVKELKALEVEYLLWKYLSFPDLIEIIQATIQC